MVWMVIIGMILGFFSLLLAKDSHIMFKEIDKVVARQEIMGQEPSKDEEVIWEHFFMSRLIFGASVLFYIVLSAIIVVDIYKG